MHSERDFTWKEVGERIRQWRTARGISQVKLAHSAGITGVGILRVEHGEVNPRLDTLCGIARGMRCSVRELLTGANERPTSDLEALLSRTRRVLESSNVVAVKAVKDALETAEAILGIKRLDPDHIFPPSMARSAKVKTRRPKKGKIIRLS